MGPVLLRFPGLSRALFLLLALPCRLDLCLPRLFRICLPFLLPFSFPCFFVSVGWDLLVLQRAPVQDLSRPCFVAIVLRRGIRLLFSPRVSVRRCGCPRCSGRLHPVSIARFRRACCVVMFLAAAVRVFLATAVCALKPQPALFVLLRHGPACSCFLYPTSNRVYFLLLFCYFGRVGDLLFIPVWSPQRFSPSLCFTP